MALVLACLVVTAGTAAAQCLDHPNWQRCEGCGCKGGPGYREHATGQCVGFRDLQRRCGPAPHTSRCTFENHPNAGLNRDCALSRTPRTPRPGS